MTETVCRLLAERPYNLRQIYACDWQMSRGTVRKEGKNMDHITLEIIVISGSIIGHLIARAIDWKQK
mgnify:CR=1 FL=1